MYASVNIPSHYDYTTMNSILSPNTKKRRLGVYSESTSALHSIEGHDLDTSMKKRMKRTTSFSKSSDEQSPCTMTIVNDSDIAPILLLLKSNSKTNDMSYYPLDSGSDVTTSTSSTTSCTDSEDELDESNHNIVGITNRSSHTISNAASTMKKLHILDLPSTFTKPTCPDDFVRVLYELKRYPKLVYKSAQSLKDVGFFPSRPSHFVSCFTMDVVQAVRNDDVTTLRNIVATKYHNDTSYLICGNSFGDSIIHMACRRNCYKVLEYLLNECAISPQIVCDYGRTPLHDALWTSKPNIHILTLLLNHCPALLFVMDNRGATPLSYAPKQQHKFICRFIVQYVKIYGMKRFTDVWTCIDDRIGSIPAEVITSSVNVIPLMGQ